MAKDSIERLRSRTKVDNGGCWEWQGAKSSRGYGVVYSNDKNKTVQAHRLAYELANGPIECGMVVRHMCHNPICINPSHLKSGTQADNANDHKIDGKLHRRNRARLRRDPCGRELPTGVYFKNGAYHMVRRNKWKRLSNDYEEAVELAASELDNL